MSDDFGLLNLAVSPILERVVQEERLSGDQPRKQRNLKSKLVRKAEELDPLETTEESNDSISSNHIDLRI